MTKKKLRFLASLIIMSLVVTLAPCDNVYAKVKVKLSKNKLTIYKGKKKTIKLKGATKKQLKKTKWKTSAKNVAKIKVNKKRNKVTITGKNTGKAVVSVKVGKKWYKCKVTVKKKSTNKTTKPTATNTPSNTTVITTPPPIVTNPPAATSTPESGKQGGNGGFVDTTPKPTDNWNHDDNDDDDDEDEPTPTPVAHNEENQKKYFDTITGGGSDLTVDTSNIPDWVLTAEDTDEDGNPTGTGTYTNTATGETKTETLPKECVHSDKWVLVKVLKYPTTEQEGSGVFMCLYDGNQKILPLAKRSSGSNGVTIADYESSSSGDKDSTPNYGYTPNTTVLTPEWILIGDNNDGTADYINPDTGEIITKPLSNDGCTHTDTWVLIKVVKQATTSSTGIGLFMCTKDYAQRFGVLPKLTDDGSYDLEELPDDKKPEWILTEETTPSDEDTEGEGTWTNTKTGETKTDKIPVKCDKELVLIKVLVQPTVKKSGKALYGCLECGYQTIVILPPLESVVDKNTTDGTTGGSSGIGDNSGGSSGTTGDNASNMTLEELPDDKKPEWILTEETTPSTEDTEGEGTWTNTKTGETKTDKIPVVCDDELVLIKVLLEPTVNRRGKGLYGCLKHGYQTILYIPKLIPTSDTTLEELPDDKKPEWILTDETTPSDKDTEGEGTWTNTKTGETKTDKIPVKCEDELVLIKILRQPTAYRSGRAIYGCLKCGYQTIVTLPPLGSTSGDDLEELPDDKKPEWILTDETTPSTEDTDGEGTWTNTKTGETKTDKIPVKCEDELVLIKILRQPTVKKSGKALYGCLKCGYQTIVTLPPLSSTSDGNLEELPDDEKPDWILTNETTPSTEDTEGEGTWTNTKTGETKTDKIPVVCNDELVLIKILLEPTVNRRGKALYGCLKCGYQTIVYIPKLTKTSDGDLEELPDDEKPDWILTDETTPSDEDTEGEGTWTNTKTGETKTDKIPVVCNDELVLIKILRQPTVNRRGKGLYGCLKHGYQTILYIPKLTKTSDATGSGGSSSEELPDDKKPEWILTDETTPSTEDTEGEGTWTNTQTGETKTDNIPVRCDKELVLIKILLEPTVNRRGKALYGCLECGYQTILYIPKLTKTSDTTGGNSGGSSSGTSAEDDDASKDDGSGVVISADGTGTIPGGSSVIDVHTDDAPNPVLIVDNGDGTGTYLNTGDDTTTTGSIKYCENDGYCSDEYFELVRVITYPTAYKEGKGTFICKRHPEVQRIMAIPKLKTYDTVTELAENNAQILGITKLLTKITTEPTTTEVGKGKYSNLENNRLSVETVYHPEHGHASGDAWVPIHVWVESTETTEGLATFYCTECGKQYIFPLGKLYKGPNPVLVQDNGDGTGTYINLPDGTPVVKELEKEDEECQHTTWRLNYVVSEPTVDSEGLGSYSCEECGYQMLKPIERLYATEEEAIEALQSKCSHSSAVLEDWVVTKTKLVTLQDEEGHYVDEDGEPLEEGEEPIQQEVAIEWDKSTCSHAGSKVFYCPDCGYVGVCQVEADPDAHKLEVDEKGSVAPTCTKDGVEEYVCSICGATSYDEGTNIKSRQLQKLGHNHVGINIDDGNAVTPNSNDNFDISTLDIYNGEISATGSDDSALKNWKVVYTYNTTTGNLNLAYNYKTGKYAILNGALGTGYVVSDSKKSFEKYLTAISEGKTEDEAMISAGYKSVDGYVVSGFMPDDDVDGNGGTVRKSNVAVGSEKSIEVSTIAQKITDLTALSSSLSDDIAKYNSDTSTLNKLLSGIVGAESALHSAQSNYDTNQEKIEEYQSKCNVYLDRLIAQIEENNLLDDEDFKKTDNYEDFKTALSKYAEAKEKITTGNTISESDMLAYEEAVRTQGKIIANGCELSVFNSNKSNFMTSLNFYNQCAARQNDGDSNLTTKLDEAKTALVTAKQNIVDYYEVSTYSDALKTRLTGDIETITATKESKTKEKDSVDAELKLYRNYNSVVNNYNDGKDADKQADKLGIQTYIQSHDAEDVTGRYYTVYTFYKGSTKLYETGTSTSEVSIKCVIPMADKSEMLDFNKNTIPVNFKETCTNRGYYLSLCTRCGKCEFTREDALGHNYEEDESLETDSTCIEHGHTYAKCTLCGETKVLNTKELAEHKLNSNGVCEVCGAVSIDNILTKSANAELKSTWLKTLSANKITYQSGVYHNENVYVVSQRDEMQYSACNGLKLGSVSKDIPYTLGGTYNAENSMTRASLGKSILRSAYNTYGDDTYRFDNVITGTSDVISYGVMFEFIPNNELLSGSSDSKYSLSLPVADEYRLTGDVSGSEGSYNTSNSDDAVMFGTRPVGWKEEGTNKINRNSVAPLVKGVSDEDEPDESVDGLGITNGAYGYKYENKHKTSERVISAPMSRKYIKDSEVKDKFKKSDSDLYDTSKYGVGYATIELTTSSDSIKLMNIDSEDDIASAKWVFTAGASVTTSQKLLANVEKKSDEFSGRYDMGKYCGKTGNIYIPFKLDGDDRPVYLIPVALLYDKSASSGGSIRDGVIYTAVLPLYAKNDTTTVLANPTLADMISSYADTSVVSSKDYSNLECYHDSTYILLNPLTRMPFYGTYSNEDEDILSQFGLKLEERQWFTLTSKDAWNSYDNILIDKDSSDVLYSYGSEDVISKRENEGLTDRFTVPFDASHSNISKDSYLGYKVADSDDNIKTLYNWEEVYNVRTGVLRNNFNTLTGKVD